MSDAGLDIIIKARNDADKALKQVHDQLGDVEKRGHSAADGIGKLAGVLKGALVAAVGAVSIKLLADGLSDMVGAAMEAEDIQADLNATLASTKGVSGMTTESINELAESLSKVTRFEDDSIVSAQAMLLTFTNIGKDVFPRTTEATLNMAQKFKMDASQAAITLGKALNDPISGVGSLRRIGVQLTEQQEEQIKTMLDAEDGMWAYADATERAELMAKAQTIILNELDTELGGVARAAGETAAGKMEIFKNKLGNVKEEIGARFLPILSKMADALSAALDNPRVQKALEVLFTMIDKVVTALTSGQAPVVKFSGVMGGLQKTVTELGEKVIAFVQQQLLTVTKWVEDNRPLIEAFGQTVGVWANNMLQAISRLWDFVGPALNSLMNLVLGLAKAVMQIATGDWQGAWDTITSTVTTHMQTVWNSVTGIIGGIVTWIGEQAPNLMAKGGEIMQGLINGIGGAYWGLVDAGKAGVQSVINWIGERYWDFLNMGSNMIWGLINGINGAKDALIENIKQAIWDAIDAIRKLLGLPSPSKVMFGFGLMTMQGLANGITDGSGLARQAMTDMAESLRLVTEQSLLHGASMLQGSMGGVALSLPSMGGPAAAYSTATNYSNSAAYNVQVNDGLSGALLLDQMRREQERRITRYM